MTFGRGGHNTRYVNLRSLRGAPRLSYVEHLTRTLSWTFVFGAVATLLYTSFKPYWNELLSGEFPPDQVQGAMIEAKEPAPDATGERVNDRQLAEAATCPENSVSDDRCLAQTP